MYYELDTDFSLRKSTLRPLVAQHDAAKSRTTWYEIQEDGQRKPLYYHQFLNERNYEYELYFYETDQLYSWPLSYTVNPVEIIEDPSDM